MSAPVPRPPRAAVFVKRATDAKRVADLLWANNEAWAAVALYYSALHYAQALIAVHPQIPDEERDPRHHNGLDDRGRRGRNLLLANIVPEDDLAAYDTLEVWSRKVRYRGAPVGDPDYALLCMQYQAWVTYVRTTASI